MKIRSPFATGMFFLVFKSSATIIIFVRTDLLRAFILRIEHLWRLKMAEQTLITKNMTINDVVKKTPKDHHGFQ